MRRQESKEAYDCKFPSVDVSRKNWWISMKVKREEQEI